MAIKNILLATEAGLGQGETPIFPIHIFKVKAGVSFNPEDPNYDLFKLACRVSAKRLFPNFSFIDAPFNLQYYKPGHPETEVSYMGCRTRVLGNHYNPQQEITYGRGNLSFTSINLPRLAIKANHNLDLFFDDLERKMDLVAEQLLDRFKIQSHKKVRNFPFLMGQGVWLGSRELGIDDEVGEVLKNGTLSIGFIGLAETLVALTMVNQWNHAIWGWKLSASCVNTATTSQKKPGLISRCWPHRPRVCQGALSALIRKSSASFPVLPTAIIIPTVSMYRYIIQSALMKN